MARVAEIEDHTQDGPFDDRFNQDTAKRSRELSVSIASRDKAYTRYYD
jgi:hypothetical protein